MDEPIVHISNSENLEPLRDRFSNMSLEEEWLTSIVAESTKNHHKKGWQLFKQFLGLETEKILELRKKEGKRFVTRIVAFYKELINQGLSENTSRSYVIPIQSFFSYFECPIKVSDKLPRLHMKIESWRPSLNDLQKLYALNDLDVKAWLSLSRDCPARIGDLLKISQMLLKNPKTEELVFKSQKENVIGKCYFSEQTRELFSLKPKIPTSPKGIDKLWLTSCGRVKLPKIHQHLLRKYWITTALNLGIPETIIKILSFKAVPKEDLTYYLDREDLKSYWLKIINAIPLEAKSNNKVSSLEESLNLVLKALSKLIIKELEKEGVKVMGLTTLSSEQILEIFVREEHGKERNP